MASWREEKEEHSDTSPWKCPLCLGDYKSPKLLPCSHTFCKECLVDLLKHQGTRYRTSFPCPSCRETVQVPIGGVEAFKTNYYLDTTHSMKKQQLMCKVHDSKQRELELFCHQCKTCICLECKLEGHLNHHTEEVEKVSKAVKTSLVNDLTGLTSTIFRLKGKLRSFSAEQRAIQDKKTAVENDILRRHRVMVSLADKCRDEALFSLDTVSASAVSILEGVVSKGHMSLDQLEKLKKRMEICVKEEDSLVLVTAEEIYRDESECREEVQRFLTSQISVISRPVLRFRTSADVTMNTQRQFLGSVERMDMAVSSVELSVKLLFTCALPSRASEVYSLFPWSDDTVWISYEVCGLSEDFNAGCPQRFTQSGKVIETETSVKGRASFTHTKAGKWVCTGKGLGSFTTYAKSRRLVQLENHLNGTGVITENESTLSPKLNFLIICGPHRAFDAEDDMTMFAVVEEAQPPESQRKVLMYQQPSSKPVSTYCPPVQPFQPSDVCFCTLGDRNVLLVADELNDTIHIVQQESGQLVFRDYLAAGNPLITQPTALNIHKGSLWIACRTGNVLLC
ncbi:uncharacterized protein LOC143297856 [Babylonia areolata]|uniref:uncharacterized protein LOC143297856 n=1 Tax=Babylonia areolata TaxID=304850 RepID=UPI003FD03397